MFLKPRLNFSVFLIGIVLVIAAVFSLFFYYGEIKEVFGFADEEKQPPSKQMRTLKFSIFSNPSVMVSGTSTTTPFSIFIGDQSPVIKSAHIEVKGVTKASVSQTITLDVNQTDSFPTQREESFLIDSGGSSNHFQIFYSGSGSQTLADYFYGIINNPGAYGFYFKLGVSGADISAVHAKLIITYQFTPPSAGSYPVAGELISAVFDTTGISDGPAYNSAYWKGTLGGAGQNQGKVRLQLATSDSENGPWNYYGGNSCASGDWYNLGGSDNPVELICNSDYHNNQRYFRYKIQICSDDCSVAGNSTPTVEDVVISWSP